MPRCPPHSQAMCAALAHEGVFCASSGSRVVFFGKLVRAGMAAVSGLFVMDLNLPPFVLLAGELLV